MNINSIKHTRVFYSSLILSSALLVVTIIITIAFVPLSSYWKAILLSIYVIGMLLHAAVSVLSFMGYRRLSVKNDGFKTQQEDVLRKMNRDILDLESKNKEAMLRINQLEKEQLESKYPLENRLTPLLSFLNDVYLECEEYGETYSSHIKRRVQYILKSQGYEYIDYNTENTDYYTISKSNYDTDTITQPALINSKTKKCVIRGMVFIKGN